MIRHHGPRRAEPNMPPEAILERKCPQKQGVALRTSENNSSRCEGQAPATFLLTGSRAQAIPRHVTSRFGVTLCFLNLPTVSCDVARSWQNAATLLRAARTQMFLKNSRNILCVRHKCCARGKTSQHLGNMITSAMLPPQCVPVLPAP